MAEQFAGTALLLVDVQNDFCPGGALAVRDGDAIIPIINRLIPKFDLTIAGLDWHPSNHISFRERGGPWPPHCVRGTDGARLHGNLNTETIADTFHKASAPDEDAYSEFEGVDETGRSLDQYLHAKGVGRLIIAGLATDYCVKATALDAIRLGYHTTVVTDAVRAVNVDAQDGAKALAEMQAQGVTLLSSEMVLRRSGTHPAIAADR